MKNLFRKEAVDNYKDQFSIDKQIKKLSPSTLILAPIFVLGMIFTGIWFVFGNIVNTVNVTGIVYPTNGIEKITASNEGIISNISVSVGENIKSGHIVAIIPNEELLNQINEAGDDETLRQYLRQKYINESIVFSENSGTVLSTAEEGTYIQKGDVIAVIASQQKDNNKKQIFALLPTSQKNNITKGCAVQVSPNYAPREKFGYINGYVVDISDIIITRKDAEKEFDIFNIPNLLNENETYIAVYINLLSNPDNESGLDWSEKSSGNIDIGMGTVCKGSIVVSSQPPYKWLLGGGTS